MGLGVIEEKNLNDVITYALDYPNVVLSEIRALHTINTEEFSIGLYIGYICGVFYDGFLERNKRFLDLEESSDFNSIIVKQIPEIKLKIQAHLRKK